MEQMLAHSQSAPVEIYKTHAMLNAYIKALLPIMGIASKSLKGETGISLLSFFYSVQDFLSLLCVPWRSRDVRLYRPLVAVVEHSNCVFPVEKSNSVFFRSWIDGVA